MGVTTPQGVRILRITLLSDRNGRLSAAFVVRTWTGRETMDRRATPSSPLGSPPPCPPAVNPIHWVMAYAANRLLGEDAAGLAYRAALREPQRGGGGR